LTQTPSNTSRTFLRKFTPFLVLLCLTHILPPQSLAKPAAPTVLTAEGTRLYRVRVTSIHENLTSSYYGTQSVSLNATDSFGYEAVLSWNITFNDGQTWIFNSVQVSYDWNRTYTYGGMDWYTAWWIHPNVQLGSKVRIDGDVPATNNHPRTQPFTVTDLLSIDLNLKYYLCWQLIFTTSQQREQFYYDFYTGLLLKATSIVEDSGQPVHEINLTLESAFPSLPTLHILHHFWITYDSILIALIGASLTTLFVFYLIRRLREYRFHPSFIRNLKHKA